MQGIRVISQSTVRIAEKSVEVVRGEDGGEVEQTTTTFVDRYVRLVECGDKQYMGFGERDDFTDMMYTDYIEHAAFEVAAARTLRRVRSGKLKLGYRESGGCIVPV